MLYPASSRDRVNTISVYPIFFTRPMDSKLFVMIVRTGMLITYIYIRKYVKERVYYDL